MLSCFKEFNCLEKILVASEVTADEHRKRAFLAVCILVIIPAIIPFALIDLTAGRLVEGALTFSLASAMVINLFALRQAGNILPRFRLTTLLILAMLGYELAIGGGEGTILLWFYILPLGIFFLFGKNEGSVWILLSFGMTTIFIFWGAYPSPPGLYIRFLVTYAIVSILTFGFEASRDRFYRALQAEKLTLELTLEQVKTLKGLLPICAACKSIRDDQGYWNQIELYISQHSEVEFSHGLCPDCARELYPQFYKNLDSPRS